MAAGRLHDPTEHRLLQARRAGDVPRSRVLSAAAVVVAIAALGAAQGRGLSEAAQALFRLGLEGVRQGRGGPAVLADMAALTAVTVGPIVLWLFVAALVASLAQIDWSAGGSGASGGPARSGDRIGRRLVQECIRWALIACVVAVLSLVCLSALRGVLSVPMGELSLLWRAGGTVLWNMLAWTAGALVFLSVVDLLLQRAVHRRSLRMTDAELLDERRQTDLDPGVFAERRRLQRQVSSATDAVLVRDAALVVVSRAGHLVALHRDAGQTIAPVPVVTVNVRGPAAEQLLLAASAGTSLPVFDDALAQDLALLQPGQSLPRHLFVAVAAHLRRGTDHGGALAEGAQVR